LHQGADSKVQHLGIIFSDRGSREAALIHANQQEHLMAIDVKTIERGALHEAKEFFWVFLYLYLCIGMLVVDATFHTICKVSLRATTGIAFVPVILFERTERQTSEGLQGWPLHVWRQ
jgi:hypothetical protein